MDRANMQVAKFNRVCNRAGTDGLRLKRRPLCSLSAGPKCRLVLSLVGLLMGLSAAQAQDGTFKMDMPSPTAASFAKAAETPVNLFKGQPDITIPLYTLTRNDLSVPIRLSYDASGVKVQEIADWVGLNWRLYSGGMVSRVMRGNPDEWTNGYMNTGDNTDLVGFAGLNNNDKYTFLTQYLKSQVDPEPDIFYYSFPGHSGKFLIAPGGQVYGIPQNNLKIALNGIPNTNSDLGGFTITTADGTEYIFDKIEEIIQTSGSITTPDYASAWYLTKINSARGDASIDLSYNSSTIRVTHESPVYEARYTVLTTGAPPNVYETGYTKYERVYLEQITAGDKKLTFSRSLREDARNPTDNSKQEYKLDHITVTDLSTNTTEKTIQFTYSQHSGRLFLDAVQTEGMNGVSVPPYTFHYISRDNLPDRLSFAVDHWGYYNGHTSNTSYIPPTIMHAAGMQDRYFPGADRSANASTIDYGTLDSITYPTGGKTVFEYEPHEYGSVAYPIGADLTDVDVTTHTYFANAVGSEDTYYFTIQNDVESSTLVEISGRMQVIDDAGVYIRIVDDSNGNVLHQYVPPSGGGGGGGPPPRGDFSDSFLLPNGDYRIVLQRQDQDDLVEATLTYYETIIVNKKTGGGLRLKKMTMSDGMDPSKDIVKTYTYGTSSESYGVLYTNPDYDYIFAAGYDGTLGSGNLNFYARLSTPVRAFGGEGRRFMGYKKVIVGYGANAENGTKEYEFTTSVNGRTLIRNMFDGWDHGVFIAQPDESYRFGHITKAAAYSAAGALQQQTDSQYFFYDDAPPDDERVYKEFAAMAYYEVENNEFKYHYYYMLAPWTKKTSTAQKVYNGQSNPVTTTTGYTYNDWTYKQLSQKTQTNSDGSQRITQYTYAHEHYSPMESLNMLRQPYKVLIKNGPGTILRIDWTLWDSFNGDWHPCARYVGGAGLGTAAPASCN